MLEAWLLQIKVLVRFFSQFATLPPICHQNCLHHVAMLKESLIFLFICFTISFVQQDLPFLTHACRH